MCVCFGVTRRFPPLTNFLLCLFLVVKFLLAPTDDDAHRRHAPLRLDDVTVARLLLRRLLLLPLRSRLPPPSPSRAPSGAAPPPAPAPRLCRLHPRCDPVRGLERGHGGVVVLKRRRRAAASSRPSGERPGRKGIRLGPERERRAEKKGTRRR